MLKYSAQAGIWIGFLSRLDADLTHFIQFAGLRLTWPWKFTDPGAGFWYHPSPGPVTRHSFTKVANSGAKLFNHPPLPHLSFSASQSTSSPRRPFSIKPWQFTFLADVKAAQECEMWYKWNIRKKRLHNETLRNPRNYWSPALLISIVQTFW